MHPRKSIEGAVEILGQLTLEWGLTVSVQKTKLMVAGTLCESVSDFRPICIRGKAIETVSTFTYLGAIVEEKGGIKSVVEERIVRALRAFGALRRPDFGDKDLSLMKKRLVYRAVVLGILLYGTETWANRGVPQQVCKNHPGDNVCTAQTGLYQYCADEPDVRHGGVSGRSQSS